MKTIQVKDILDIYKMCGLTGEESTIIRNTLNLGTLSRKINLGTTTITSHSTVKKLNISTLEKKEKSKR